MRWKNEWSYLAHVPRALTTFRGILKVSSAGTLTGLEAPVGSRTVELKPYALSGVSTDRTVVPASERDFDGRVGGDVKYGLTQNLTADLTVNTDFAQVEVDEQQVNLTRFNLFFPEKRDFFLEGAGTFAFAGRASAGLAAGSGDTPYLFFSRRIGLDAGGEIPLLGGGRLTGKSGRTTVGALNVQTGSDDGRDVDSAPTSPCCGSSATSSTAVPSARMYTHRTATPGRLGSNDGVGVDASFGFFQNLRVDSYLAATRSERRDRGQSQLPRLHGLQRRSLRRATGAAGGPTRASCPRSASCAAPTSAATSPRCASVRGRGASPPSASSPRRPA